MPYESGSSGNPQGRPGKNVSLTHMLRRELNGVDPKTRKKKKKVIAENVVNDAVAGKWTAIEFIFNRIDGPMAQPLSIESQGTVIHEWSGNPAIAAAIRAWLEVAAGGSSLSSSDTSGAPLLSLPDNTNGGSVEVKANFESPPDWYINGPNGGGGSREPD